MTSQARGAEVAELAREVLRDRIAPRPRVEECRGTPAWRLLVDAAAVGAFLPRDLAPDLVQGAERSEAEKSVLRFSEVALAPEGARWALTRGARVAVLAYSDRGDITAAAERMHRRLGDPMASALRRCLTQSVRDFSAASVPELEAICVVLVWLRGVPGVELPPREELERHLALRRLLAPFERMIGRTATAVPARTRPDRFFGRDREMEDLRGYVAEVAAETVAKSIRRTVKDLHRAVTGRRAKVVWGTGGVGKTTLIAKFMLEHAVAAASRFPFAYLDFERSTINARNRASLLAEMCRQVGAQFDSLTAPMTALSDRLAEVSRHADSGAGSEALSLLVLHAREFRELIDTHIPPARPFLLVLDSFEIVQYGPDQVVGLEELIGAIAGGKTADWHRLRLILSGRRRVPQFLGDVEELELGALDRAGSTGLLVTLAHDAGKWISEHTAGRLVDAIARQIGERGNQGVRPLHLRLIGDLFRRDDQDGPEIVRTLLDDLANPPGKQRIVGRALVEGILVRRILGHIRDPRVYALADPGLVVRRITPEVIREVMTRGTPKPGVDRVRRPDGVPGEPWVIDDAEARSIFEAFRGEGLVDPDGEALRHREDLRQDMLPLIEAGSPIGFEHIHRLAYAWFRDRATRDRSDLASAAEAVYHGLWLRKRCEELDDLWPENGAFDPRIDAEEFRRHPSSEVYVRARMRQPLSLPDIRKLPPSVAIQWLASRSAELLGQMRLDEAVEQVRAVGGTRYEAFDERPDLAAVVARLLYRAGHWRDAISIARRHLGAGRGAATDGQVSLLRTWAMILAKSGAEPERLARFLTAVPSIEDPVIRTEILAHISLGLLEEPSWRDTRDYAEQALAVTASTVPEARWRHEGRVLRLVLASRVGDYQGLANIYISDCDRFPRDAAALEILRRWLGDDFAEEDVDRVWSRNRARLLRVAARHPEDVCVIAAADHSDWILPLGNALSRGFRKHARAIEQALRGAAPVGVAKQVKRALEARDGLSLLELLGERGMLRIASRLRERDRRAIPESAGEFSDVFLRWHRLSTGDPEKSSDLEPLPAVSDLVAAADWGDLTRRLLLFANDVIRRSPPRGAGTGSDPHQLVVDAMGEIMDVADMAAADASLFVILAKRVREAVERESIPDDLERMLAAADWSSLVPRLLAFARWRLARLGPRASGMDPSDVVQEAIVRVATGRRSYSQLQEKPLFEFLCSVIDSLVSHYAEKEIRRGQHLPIGIGEPSEDSAGDVVLVAADSSAHFLARDQFERFLSGLEPRLAAYVRLRSRDEHETAEEYAEALGTTVNEIRNLHRRLQRLRWKWPV